MSVNSTKFYGTYGKLEPYESSKGYFIDITNRLDFNKDEENIEIKRRIYNKEQSFLRKIHKNDLGKFIKYDIFDENHRKIMVFEEFHDNLIENIRKKSNNPLIIRNIKLYKSIINEIFNIYECILNIISTSDLDSIDNVTLYNFLIKINDSNEATIKFIDFGLSLLVSNPNDKLMSIRLGVPFGFAPEFFSKESLIGKSRLAYLIWSLGVILFQFTFYSHPFGRKRKEIQSIIMKLYKNDYNKESLSYEIKNILNSNEEVRKEMKEMENNIINWLINKSNHIRNIYKFLFENIFLKSPSERIEFQELKVKFLNFVDLVNENQNENNQNENKERKEENKEKPVENNEKPIEKQEEKLNETITNLLNELNTKENDNKSLHLPTESMLDISVFEIKTENKIDISNSLVNRLYNEVQSTNSLKTKFTLSTILLGPYDWNIEFPYDLFRSNGKDEEIDLKSIEKVQYNPTYSVKVFKEILNEKKSVPSIENLLALCLEKGIGDKVNTKEAFRLLTKSSESSYLPAKINLSRYYFYGIEVSKDVNLARKMIGACRNTTDFPSLYMLCHVYFKGEVIEKDVSIAEMYCDKCMMIMKDHPIVLYMKKEIVNIRQGNK